MNETQETFRDLIAEPDKRFQKFFDFYCNNLPMNHDLSIDRYIRSGDELIRMAKIYLDEQDFLHAFVLYSRYTVLFLDKIKTHPQYSTFDKTKFSTINKNLKTIVFPRAEKLKQFIKGNFENEAKEHKKKMEEEDKLKKEKNDKNSEILIKPSAPNELDLNEVKKKFNIENENELSKFKELEISSIRDSNNKKETNQEDNYEPVAGTIPKPTFDRKLKPIKTNNNNNQANNYNLRTVYMPGDLIRKFLDLSESNTVRNVETCGILAGKLSKNEFVISHCIIPKQNGTSDTCSTEQEYELFDTIDSLNLITLGWIHTHPSQTAFLSSIDLHTQLGYQIMIPEAIAVVCAPSYNENGIFILIPDYGMKQILECKANGFHPHQTNPPLFEESDHVVEDQKLKVVIVDLRMISKLKN